MSVRWKYIVGVMVIMSVQAWSITLPKITLEALTQGTQVNIARQQVAMGESDVSIVGRLPNPVLGYGWYGESVETKTGPQEQKFSITQKIPWLGKLKDQIDIAEAEVDKYKFELQAVQTNTVYQVRMIWSEMCYLTKARDINKQTLDLYLNWSEKLRTDYESSRTSYSRVIKMETEITLLKEDIETIERKIQDQYHMLATYLGRTITGETFTDSLMQYTSLDGGEELTNLWEHNPMLKKRQQILRIWKEKEALLKNNYFPNVILGATYIQTGDTPGMAESGKDPWMLSVGVSVPVNVLQTNARVQKAHKGTQKTSTMIQETKNRLTEIINKTQSIITEAKRKQVVYNKSVIPEIGKSISVQENQFAAGKIDFMQLLDDYRMLLKLQLRVHQAIKTEFQAKAKILWVTGDIQHLFKYPYKTVSKETP